MSQKFLISACTSKYDHLEQDQQRPLLYHVVSAINQLFTQKLGYKQELDELNGNPTANDLRVKLDKWFASDERQVDDWVVLYYTGHGELIGSDALYFLTREFESGFITSTAFPVSQLGEMIISPKANGENRLVRRLLLILDTCHSGVGGFELSRKLSSLFSQGINGSMFYILAAAFPNEEAMSGALANALIEALESEATTGKHQEFIYFDQLIPVINQKLRKHKVVYLPVSSPDIEPEFFPNPYYIGKPLP
ncbi:caspase family protein, partial [Nostoc sp. CHAB 5834]|nr:caspase family protein [Nostoc sp. CHAB 5834]